MRIFGRRLVVLIGALLLLVGGGSAVFVGPQDEAHLPSRVVSGGTPVTLIGWRFLSYEDTTLRVVVSSSAGDVFVGAASPVDVESYLAGARVLDVHSISPSGKLDGEVVRPEGKAPEPSAGSLTFWAAKTSGPGEQQLDLPLTGNPTSIVVVAPTDAQLSIGLGVVVPGLFRAAVTVAIVGVLVMLLGLLLTLRAKRRAAADGPPADGSERAAPMSPERGATVERRPSAHWPAFLAAVLTGVSVAGCVSLPPRSAAPTGEVTKVALSPSEAAATIKDLDARSKEVLAGIVAGGDVKAWGRVSTGVALMTDVLNATEVPMHDGKANYTIQTTSMGRSWSPRFAAYPMWAMVQRTPDAADGQPMTDKSHVVVLQRVSAIDEWKVAYGFLIDGTLPAPDGVDVDVTATAQETSSVWEAAKPFAAYLTGASKDVEPSKVLPAIRDALGRVVIEQTSVRSSCDLWDAGSLPLGLTRAVRTPDGIFGTAVLRCTKTSTADPGREIWWNEAHAKAIGGDTAHVKTLTEIYGVVLGLLVHPDRSVTVVGGDYYPVPLNAALN